MNGLTVFNTDVIPVYTTNTGQKVVVGRELHECLGIKTNYKDWFPRMVEYGFVEGGDFNPLKTEQVRKEGNRMVTREILNHVMSLDMAKHIAMIQRTEAGKQIRQKLIDLEKVVAENPNILSGGSTINLNDITGIISQIVSQTVVSVMSAMNEGKTDVPKEDGKTDSIKNDHIPFHHHEETLTVSQLAARYGKTSKEFNQLLAGFNVQIRDGQGWKLCDQYEDKGYAKYVSSRNSSGPYKFMVWKKEGCLFLYELLKSNGIRPFEEETYLSDLHTRNKCDA